MFLLQTDLGESRVGVGEQLEVVLFVRWVVFTISSEKWC